MTRSELLSQVLDSIGVGVTVFRRGVDDKTPLDMIIVYSNPQARVELGGLDLHAHEGRRLKDVFERESLFLEAAFNLAGKDGEQHVFRRVPTQANGTFKGGFYDLIITGLEGSWAMITGRDVTRLVEAEEEANDLAGRLHSMAAELREREDFGDNEHTDPDGAPTKK